MPSAQATLIGYSWGFACLCLTQTDINLDLAQQYETLKYELADRFRGDREAYTKAKQAFISKALIASE